MPGCESRSLSDSRSNAWLGAGKLHPPSGGAADAALGRRGQLADRGAHPRTIDRIDDRPPEPLEAAAYFVVAEALTNIARYASARAASVIVRREADDVLVEVTDDGSGVANPDAGSGLRGLIDRVEALGGRLEVQSPIDRGTTVRAWLPEI